MSLIHPDAMSYIASIELFVGFHRGRLRRSNPTAVHHAGGTVMMDDDDDEDGEAVAHPRADARHHPRKREQQEKLLFRMAAF